MNHIIYGRNKIEESIFLKEKSSYSKDETIIIDSDQELYESLSIIRFRPFFNDKWFLIINMDKINSEAVVDVIRLLKNDKVKCYIRINLKRDLYASIRKSKTLNELDGLIILNAKFPSDKYISDILLTRVNKNFSNSVIKYVANNVRFNIDKLDGVIEDMNGFDYREITLDDIKKILPQSKTRDIKSICYSLLLCDREDLKANWKDKDAKVLVQNAGTKLKPYQIVEEINMEPKYLLDLIIKIMKDMIKVKKLYMRGTLTESNVFKEKERLENVIPFLKTISIPACREYILVTREVTNNEINYCLNEFVMLKQNNEISMEDIYLTIYKLMNRHKDS